MAIRPAAQGATFRRRDDESATLEVVLHHDVLCAWCYVADARLDYLRDEYGPLVRWKLQAYPVRPEARIPDQKQRASLAREFRRVARQPEGRAIQADLWTGNDPPLSSLAPLVALEAALPQGPRIQRQLLKAMRRKAFIEGINVARRDVQVELAAQVGIDLPDFLERLDDPRLEQQVLDRAEEAEGLGIKGVPALVIGGEWLVQGCRDLDEYRQVLDKYLRERVAAAQVRVMH